MAKHAKNKWTPANVSETASLAAVCAAMVGIALVVGSQGAAAHGSAAVGQDAPAPIVDKDAQPEPEPGPVDETEWTYVEPTYEAPAYDYWSDPQIWGNVPADYNGGGTSGGLTASSGVNYYDGRRETYYSSAVLYHYSTGEWSVDSDGFYRTAEGQYVVAASDMPQGTVFHGSKGECIVLDSGCAAGTTDYYVNWN